ncbi:hypothetical protein [Flavobacterium sp.]|jgi:hypothetical protein|uniref:hypothetical protein n=1 Tax=Flavobacterium sp. TaxID=239 RepID=UPI0037BEE5F6
MKYKTDATSLVIDEQEYEIKNGIVEGFFEEGFAKFHGLTPIVEDTQEKKEEHKKETVKRTPAKKD